MITDEDLLALLGTRTSVEDTAVGVVERRAEGALARAIDAFFPVEGASGTRIEPVAEPVSVVIDPRPTRPLAIFLHATMVHAGERTQPTPVYFTPLPRTVRGFVITAKGSKLASGDEVVEWYRAELAGLRRKVESRLRRIARAIAKGERGFYPHDAWPET